MISRSRQVVFTSPLSAMLHLQINYRQTCQSINQSVIRAALIPLCMGFHEMNVFSLFHAENCCQQTHLHTINSMNFCSFILKNHHIPSGYPFQRFLDCPWQFQDWFETAVLFISRLMNMCFYYTNAPIIGLLSSRNNSHVFCFYFHISAKTLLT
jgi:hypothetical protein